MKELVRFNQRQRPDRSSTMRPPLDRWEVPRASWRKVQAKSLSPVTARCRSDWAAAKDQMRSESGRAVASRASRRGVAQIAGYNWISQVAPQPPSSRKDRAKGLAHHLQPLFASWTRHSRSLAQASRSFQHPLRPILQGPGLQGRVFKRYYPMARPAM